MGIKEKAVQEKFSKTREFQPFVKWVGGKRNVLNQLLENFPKDFNNYHEPFLGGGAVFFELYSRGLLDGKTVYLSDINSELINAFEMVKKSPNKLLTQLEKYRKQHNKEFYYQIRALDRTGNFLELSKLERATRFIYLNKTCFNGLYRVNRNGQFNTPMGSYKNPNIVATDRILNSSKALQNVNLRSIPYNKIIKDVSKDDLVYFDPPYYPLNKTSKFTSYNENQFLDDKQYELYELSKSLDKKACYVVQSNSDTAFIKDLYTEFNVQAIIMASRAINSNAQKRQKIQELFISNY
jgi:DNA adenine methylase